MTGSLPSMEAKIGKLHLPVLIDSGSARSLISFRDYQQLNRGGPVIELLPTAVSCVAASGHSLVIVGEVEVTVKSRVFNGYVFFLSARDSRHNPY
jgi:hypothetical protein